MTPEDLGRVLHAKHLEHDAARGIRVTPWDLLWPETRASYIAQAEAVRDAVLCDERDFATNERYRAEELRKMRAVSDAALVAKDETSSSFTVREYDGSEFIYDAVCPSATDNEWCEHDEPPSEVARNGPGRFRLSATLARHDCNEGLEAQRRMLGMLASAIIIGIPIGLWSSPKGGECAWGAGLASCASS